MSDVELDTSKTTRGLRAKVIDTPAECDKCPDEFLSIEGYVTKYGLMMDGCFIPLKHPLERFGGYSTVKNENIPEELIAKIENTFGFKLYSWQVDYLMGNNTSMDRRKHNVGTFIECVRILVDQSRYDEFKCLLALYRGQSRSRRSFTLWNTLFMIDEKLTNNGIVTNMKKYNEEREVYRSKLFSSHGSSCKIVIEEEFRS